MDETLHVFGGRHRIAPDRLSGRAEDRIKLIVEREAVARDVVLPMARTRDLERIQ
jgi:predicted ABC-class ATPase